jgi:tRNA1(Val) A37 N6-methylase TrmN6
VVTTGIVRHARRPAGWIAPGPSPVTPADRPEVWPQAGEDLCHLAGDWRILQRLDGHRWSLDDLVTAWVAAATPEPARIADLCCGIGTVLLGLAWRFPAARLVGVEAQAISAAMARRSILWNGAGERCTVYDGDLRDAAVLAGEAPFDLVTGTPPYLPPGTASESTRPQRGPATIEHRGGIEAYCDAAARRLAPGGRFVVCESAAQVARVERAADAAGLEIASRLDVVPRTGKTALFSVYVMRPGPATDSDGARTAARPPADAAVAPALVVRDAEGQWTAEFRAVRHAMGMPA